MKKSLLALCLILPLAACGWFNTGKTNAQLTTQYACCQGQVTNHKDQRPDDACGVCCSGMASNAYCPFGMNYDAYNAGGYNTGNYSARPANAPTSTVPRGEPTMGRSGSTNH